jgi:hypothetical protein
VISKFRHLAALMAVLIITSFSSCKDKAPAEDFSQVKGSYFSIRQYALDQWNTFYGEPILIRKTVRVNEGPYDSSYTTSDTLNWGNIFKVFFATDISDRKFLGKYKFTQFDDDQDDTHNFFYEALEEDLYTRKLLITIDQYSQKVKGIYIEASEHSVFDDKLVKLYYKPMQRIQLQNTETELLGDKTHIVTEYEFVR